MDKGQGAIHAWDHIKRRFVKNEDPGFELRFLVTEVYDI